MILLVTAKAGVERVARCCEQAAARGVGSEMTLAHARALLTDDTVHVEEFDGNSDRRVLDALAAWARRFSPVVAPDAPDGLLLDIKGCERLFHGERRLVNLVATSVHWLGVRARIATADTYGCAWAVARYGTEDRAIVPACGEREALTPLPVEALRVDAPTCDALHEVGLDRIGDLMKLTRLELSARFESELLHRLDQALGEAIEAIEPVRIGEAPRVEREFDGPVKNIAAIAIAVDEAVAKLTGVLATLESGARQIDLIAERAGAEPVRVTSILSHPSRNTKHLWTLLRPKVERLNMGFGIERIVLTATKIARLWHEQEARWRDGRAGGADVERLLGELVDALAGRLGASGTVRAEPVESHIPECAFTHEPVTHTALDEVSSPVREAGDEVVTAPERPSVLFERPEPIEVMALTRDGSPAWMKWRETARSIEASFGPERIAQEWWKDAANPSARDYFRVQDEDGRWLWVFRELETGRWFVHGQWA